MSQTLDSSLLQTRADGTRTFVHDTVQDFFLAYHFIDKINNGIAQASWVFDHLFKLKPEPRHQILYLVSSEVIGVDDYVTALSDYDPDEAARLIDLLSLDVSRDTCLKLVESLERRVGELNGQLRHARHNLSLQRGSIYITDSESDYLRTDHWTSVVNTVTDAREVSKGYISALREIE